MHNIKTDLKEIGCGLDYTGSAYGPVAGSCEHGEEPSDSRKYRGFLDQLSYYQLLKEMIAAWS
jgi:hypothetical protein